MNGVHGERANGVSDLLRVVHRYNENRLKPIIVPCRCRGVGRLMSIKSVSIGMLVGTHKFVVHLVWNPHSLAYGLVVVTVVILRSPPDLFSLPSP